MWRVALSMEMTGKYYCHISHFDFLETCHEFEWRFCNWNGNLLYIAGTQPLHSCCKIHDRHCHSKSTPVAVRTVVPDDHFNVLQGFMCMYRLTCSLYRPRGLRCAETFFHRRELYTLRCYGLWQGSAYVFIAASTRNWSMSRTKGFGGIFQWEAFHHCAAKQLLFSTRFDNIMNICHKYTKMVLDPCCMWRSIVFRQWSNINQHQVMSSSVNINRGRVLSLVDIDGKIAVRHSQLACWIYHMCLPSYSIPWYPHSMRVLLDWRKIFMKQSVGKCKQINF